MMSSEHVINVTEISFQNDVIMYSNTAPVLVDFWAEWCQPCHALSPILEKLAHESNGTFRLAKLNTDQNPNISIQMNVRSLPTVKAFDKGQVVAEFTGAQPEPIVRQFLAKLSPAQTELNLEKGLGLLNMKNWENAASAFSTTLKSRPDDGAALLGLAKTHLVQDKISEALAILREFPASKQYASAEVLLPLAEEMAKANLEQIDTEADDLAPLYLHSLNLIGRGNLAAAADGLLDLLRQDKNYRKGKARAAIVAILEIMGEKDPETRKYRNELTSVLF